MNSIVVLDGYTLNSGDLEWSSLEALGSCKVYDRTPDDLIVERAADAEILLTNKTPLMADTLEALPRLKYVGVLATGYNVVDVPAADKKDVVICNVPAYSSPSVAQNVFAHVLNLTQRVAAHAAAVNAGRWSSCPDFCFWDTPLVELKGKTMGIIGEGNIGSETACIAEAFGMQVISTNSRSSDAELEALFRASDVISIHCPLTDKTEGLINAERIEWMKSSAILVNTSRGPIVNEADLADALNRGRIAGAGLDVLSEEPPPVDHPLIGAKNCFVTPHYAWASRESRMRCLEIAVENVRCFLAGSPVNQVNATQ